MRIVVDHGSYELLNLGDVAMLQACVARLRRLWPAAEITVIAHPAAQVAALCPGTRAVPRSDGEPLTRLVPGSYREPVRSLLPYLQGRRTGPGRGQDRPATSVQAIGAADLVVAAGGGYLTDSFRWYATSVLGTISLAQRLGKPTAMLGQGIGPVRQRMLWLQLRAVLPRLDLLLLRDGRSSPELAAAAGVPAAAIAVTGDDALELVGAAGPAPGGAIGVNMRVSGYAGVDATVAAAVGQVVAETAEAIGAPVAALPVSRYADADLAAIRAMLPPRGAGLARAEVTTPQQLIAAAAGCRAIVTGSYHAAVFGLGQGVPVVCLTRSAYYAAKFAGLAELFPGACLQVSLAAESFPADLRLAIRTAVALPEPERLAALDSAARQRAAGRAGYARLAGPVTAKDGRPVAAG